MGSALKKNFFLLSVFFLVWLSLRLVLPLVFPFVLGGLLALAAEPMVSFLNRRGHLPRGVCAGIGVSLSFCFASVAVLLLCALLVRQVRALSGILPDMEEAVRSGVSRLEAWLSGLCRHLPEGIRPLVQERLDALFSGGLSLMDQILRFFLGLAGNLLSRVPDSALGIGTGILSSYFISARLPRMRQWLLGRIPKKQLDSLLNALHQVRRTITGWLTAQLKLSCVTFSLLVPGLLLLRIRHGLLWALGIALVDAFPVLGSGTVLVPWSLLCLLRGGTVQAVGLLSLYITVTLIRSALEPKLLGRHLGLDPLLTLLVLYVGYKLWGVGGMLLAPLLAVTTLQVLADSKEPSA